MKQQLRLIVEKMFALSLADRCWRDQFIQFLTITGITNGEVFAKKVGISGVTCRRWRKEGTGRFRDETIQVLRKFVESIPEEELQDVILETDSASHREPKPIPKAYLRALLSEIEPTMEKLTELFIFGEQLETEFGFAPTAPQCRDFLRKKSEK